MRAPRNFAVADWLATVLLARVTKTVELNRDSPRQCPYGGPSECRSQAASSGLGC